MIKYIIFIFMLVLISCNKKESKETHKKKMVETKIELTKNSKEIKEVKDAIKKFKYKEALALIDKLSKKYPDNAELFYLIVVISRNSSTNLLESINIAEKALIKNPKHLKTLTLLGELYFLRKDDKNAIEIWERALKIDPNNKDVVYKIAYLYFTKREYKKAITYFEKSIEVDPKHFWSYYYLSELYISFEDKPKKAIATIEKALKLLPANKELLTKAGVIYFESKKYNKAIDIFKKILENNKDDAFIMEKISDSYILLKDNDKATVWMKKIVESRKNSSYYINKLSELYANSNQIEKAVETLKYLIRIDSDPKYKYSLGLLYKKLKKKDKVEEILEYLLRDKKDREAMRYYNYLKGE